MTAIASAMNTLFDLLCAPFGGAAAPAVAVLSLPIGVLMLLLFKLATDQDKLVAARRVLTGHVYEMGLYQDHLGVLARIQKDLALANLRYLGRSLPALLAMLLPLLLILAQLDARYGHRPLLPGRDHAGHGPAGCRRGRVAGRHRAGGARRPGGRDQARARPAGPDRHLAPAGRGRGQPRPDASGWPTERRRSSGWRWARARRARRRCASGRACAGSF